MSSLPPLPSLRFNPFGPEIQTPPPLTMTLSSSARDTQPPGMVPRHLSNMPSQAQGRFAHNQQQSSHAFPNYSPHGSWSYNPAFGLIHTGTCSICMAYIEHVTMAMNNQDVSITKAVQTRKDSRDKFFTDGYALGLSHQYGNQSTTDMSLRLENTLNALGQCVAENDSLRQELEQIKRQFAALEEDPGRLKSVLAGRTSPMFSTNPRISPSRTDSTGSRSPSSSSIESFEDFHMQGITLTSSDSYTMKVVEPPEMHPYAENYLEHRNTTQVENLAQHPTTYAAVASTHAPKHPPTNVRANLPPKPRARNSHPRSGAPSDSGMAAGDGHERPRFRYPRSLQDLKDLIALSGKPTPEGAAALSVVKRVCLAAHSTPRESKTFIQKWVLINWRNPYAPANADASLVNAKPNPRIDDPVAVWFDYLCTHPHSWPKGVRKDPDGKPVISDLTANRAVARMRPTESASLRNDFIAQVTDMFSSTGMYQHLLEKNNITVSPEVTYKTFTGPVTVESVALHFAMSGVTPTDAAKNFEPWAQHYKEC